ncbi:galaxin-like [Lineus longissimus]|uniref:galaxin-like n=1 Tax=Lineus longissimus TaxID=88925 RepID=UPI00315C96C4
MMRWLDFLVLAWTGVALCDRSWACQGDQLRCGSTCYDPFESTCCSNKLIDTGNELCCDGNVRATNGNEDLQCCGAELYNWKEKKCCSTDHIIPIDYKCCRNAPGGYINMTNIFCCNGNPILYAPDVNACCGATGYNRNTAKCCRGGGRGSLLAMDDALNHGFCCATRTSDYGPIIESNPYSDKTHICCGGKIVPFTKQCCGTTVPTNNQLCCSRVAVDKRDRHSNACCYEPSTNIYHTYNSQSEFCDRAGKIHSNITQLIIRRLQEEVHVCGRRSYNTATEICCRGMLHPRLGATTQCCDLRVYDTRFDLCCKGRIKRGKSQKNYICCGRKVIAKSDQRKCPNRRHNVDDCARQSYDKTRHRCCDGILRRYYSSNQKCCGWDIFDSRKEKCCQRNFIVRKHKICKRILRSRSHRQNS